MALCFSWDWRQRSFSITAILAWPYTKKTCDDNNFGLKNLVCSSVSGLCYVTWKCHTAHKESDTRNWTNPWTQQVPRAKFTLITRWSQVMVYFTCQFTRMLYTAMKHAVQIFKARNVWREHNYLNKILIRTPFQRCCFCSFYTNIYIYIYI